MRIGIDARFLTHPQRGGFKTYTQNLVAALLRIRSPHEFVLYTDRRWNGGFDSDRVEVKRVRGAFPLLGFPWREQVTLPWSAARDGIDLFHAPAQTAPLQGTAPLVVTIHDSLSLEPPARARSAGWVHGRLLGSYLRSVGLRAARRAARILTVSETSKKALVALLGVAPEKIVVTYEAPASTYREIDRARAALAVGQRFGLHPPYILHLGSPDPRKNTETLLSAYASLASPAARGHALVIAGHATADAPAGATVRLLGAVSDDDLLHLYNAASLFVFPSRAEGFGLPALEAMACGVPVVAANRTALPEILGEAALLVPPDDAVALARAIDTVLGDTALQQDLARRGLARVAQFSWDRCAAETLAVYEAV